MLGFSAQTGAAIAGAASGMKKRTIVALHACMPIDVAHYHTSTISLTLVTRQKENFLSQCLWHIFFTHRWSHTKSLRN